jgi:hypothetical protein
MARRLDPFTAGKNAFLRGQPFDPEFGAKCKGWGTVSAQCLYETGRLKAAQDVLKKSSPKRCKKS